MLRKTKGYVSLRLSKTDYSKLNRLRGPQADTSCVTSVTKLPQGSHNYLKRQIIARARFWHEGLFAYGRCL
jgi:hypothetical protein